MFKRQTTGSVVCSSCGMLVGVNDEKCYHCGRRNPGLWGYANVLRNFGNDLGFIPLVTFGCGALYLLSLVLSMLSGGSVMGGSMFSFLGPHPIANFLLGSSGAMPVFYYGRWWTVLSAGWLHGGLLHIFLNMMAFRQIAPGVAQIYGPGRLVIIYTAGSVVGFALSSFAGAYLDFGIPFLRGGDYTVGASAAIFGLVGSLLYYGQRSGSSAIRAQLWNWVLTMAIIGFLLPGIDNYAHAGGLAGGWLAGRLLDPLQPERVNHLAGAVVCLVLSALAVIASYVFNPLA
jgi:rhomboid protease GluP